jgi:hypothetical protein
MDLEINKSIYLITTPEIQYFKSAEDAKAYNPSATVIKATHHKTHITRHGTSYPLYLFEVIGQKRNQTSNLITSFNGWNLEIGSKGQFTSCSNRNGWAALNTFLVTAPNGVTRIIEITVIRPSNILGAMKKFMAFAAYDSWESHEVNETNKRLIAANEKLKATNKKLIATNEKFIDMISNLELELGEIQALAKA